VRWQGNSQWDFHGLKAHLVGASIGIVNAQRQGSVWYLANASVPKLAADQPFVKE
jgi:hypothetical protein